MKVAIHDWVWKRKHFSATTFCNKLWKEGIGTPIEWLHLNFIPRVMSVTLHYLSFIAHFILSPWLSKRHFQKEKNEERMTGNFLKRKPLSIKRSGWVIQKGWCQLVYKFDLSDSKHLAVGYSNETNRRTIVMMIRQDSSWQWNVIIVSNARETLCEETLN